MLAMGKKKSHPEKPNRTGVSFTLWFPADLAEQIEAYCATNVPEVTKKALVIAAVRDFLRRHKPHSEADSDT